MRISLKRILVGAPLLGLYLGLLLNRDDGAFGWLSFWVIAGVTIFAGSIATAGIVYGRGYIRAFWIGSVSPSVGGSLWAVYPILEYVWDSGLSVDEMIEHKIFFATMHALMLLGGITAVLLKRVYAPTTEDPSNATEGAGSDP